MSFKIFEVAWDSITKAPFVPVPDHTMDASSLKYRPFEGTLYSGGDIGDSPTYWTKNPKEALAYALFGSAIPIKDYQHLFRGHLGDYDSGHKPPLRQTVPTIRVSQSVPDWKDYINVDPETSGYLTGDYPELPHDNMPKKEVEKLIDGVLEGLTGRHSGSYWQDANQVGYGTTMRHHLPKERIQHVREAKQRLASGVAGQLDIPDDAIYKPLMSFGESDRIEDWINNPPSELALWQLNRLINDKMFEGLPHATQEHMDELNQRMGWV